MIAKNSRALVLVLFFLLLLAGQVLCAQQQPADAADTRLDDIIKETQLSIGGKDTTGFVWWLPTEFWEQSAIQEGSTPEQAKANFAPMREYTMIIVAVGKIGIGNINWRSESEIRANTSLQDADGESYQPLKEISPDAQGIASIVKPILANILGPTGQNLQILFFPAKTPKGKPIADPTRGGSFSVVLANLTTKKESEFAWRLPLSSLSPPKFCPVGKERVEANWKFCPWHGNKLDQAPAALAAVEPKKKEDKASQASTP
jgi:hypothetical protein